eukprot:jgi/Galph1/1877/GphlegSOOS_G552.1
MHKVLAVIPARMGSTRFPGKPLALLRKIPIIVWVYRAVTKAKLVDEILVATDDERIAKSIENEGGIACLTSADCLSGTERIVQAVNIKYSKKMEQVQTIVNVQGDEPAIHPQHIDMAILPILEGWKTTHNQSFDVSTLATPIQSEEELLHPDNVKVVCSHQKEALYFSRCPIPYSMEKRTPLANGFYLRHLGIYAFHRAFFDVLPTLTPSYLENSEKLEQLTWLYHQRKIIVNIVESAWRGVDRPQDLEWLEKHLPAHFS